MLDNAPLDSLLAQKVKLIISQLESKYISQENSLDQLKLKFEQLERRNEDLKKDSKPNLK